MHMHTMFQSMASPYILYGTYSYPWSGRDSWDLSLDAAKRDESNSTSYFEIGWKIRELLPQFEGSGQRRHRKKIKETQKTLPQINWSAKHITYTCTIETYTISPKKFNQKLTEEFLNLHVRRRHHVDLAPIVGLHKGKLWQVHVHVYSVYLLHS